MEDIGSQLREWVGKQAHSDDIITPRLVNEFRATFQPYLSQTGDGEAPLAIHWCLAPEIRPMAELGADGHVAKGGFLPPVSLPRRMWAGGKIEALDALRLGDAVARRSTVSDIELKTGRSGPLCFVTVSHELSSTRGIAIRERHDIVYRAESQGGASDEASDTHNVETRSADLEWQVDASSILLFRYSAMTFNGHRFHYDYPYATGVEGYAGLVVHGPLQATLLYNLAALLGGRVPSHFSYRGIKPLIAGQPFKVLGAKTDDGVACWTADAHGRTCMEARSTSHKELEHRLARPAR